MAKTAAHFISVDGIDGVGKTTQIERLQHYLESLGASCLATRDPGSSPIGSRLRELLLESDLTMHRRTEAMLFMASRCEMVETTIRPTLEQGTSVISDRFLLANVVYQSTGSASSEETEQPATDSSTPNPVVTSDLLWQLGELANGGLRPDLTLLMDMPAERAMARIDSPADRMESRGVDYMESVRQSFLRELPRASDHVAVINADQDPDQVFGEIHQAVDRYLDSRG